jgi:hypothetical protein
MSRKIVGFRPDGIKIDIILEYSGISVYISPVSIKEQKDGKR